MTFDLYNKSDGDFQNDIVIVDAKISENVTH